MREFFLGSVLTRFSPLHIDLHLYERDRYGRYWFLIKFQRLIAFSFSFGRRPKGSSHLLVDKMKETKNIQTLYIRFFNAT